MEELDIARAIALVAMAVFHFTFDLELFGIAPPGTMHTPFWRGFAMLTAGSFILIAGLSLRLAHRGRIRWRPFLRRIAKVALAAALVTGATYVFIPQGFIYYGILHSIALSSLVGLAVLRFPVWALVFLAACVTWLPATFRSEMFTAPWLYWTGLSPTIPYTVDFEPFFPWFAPFVLGIALVKLAERIGLPARLASTPPKTSRLARAAIWAGRHSLLVYLTHQPVLLALTWALAKALGTLP
ncbi:heparan-alpha-glucosaminide N-acetyltransferase [Marinovum algicola]|uniref:heparan-alpha-glucosaminide N-acetyltransferase n=1 Tax=Marinovum algicola TaxID=42444 RepID=UPI0032EED1EC